MLQAFIIVLREAIEAFLIVAITLTYLRKTHQYTYIRAVIWGIGGSIVASGLLGYMLWKTQGVNQPFIEAAFGFVTVGLVAALVIHMWRVGPHLKEEMENQLEKQTSKPSSQASFWGIFLFTLIMISREGMETVLLLIQIQDPQMLTGMGLGIVGALAFSLLWQQFGYLINMKHFFQVTSVFLLLFIVQVAFHSFHELTETGWLPNSEALHIATEPYCMDGFYGKWYSMITLVGCGLWLVGAWVAERFSKKVAAA